MHYPPEKELYLSWGMLSYIKGNNTHKIICIIIFSVTINNAYVGSNVYIIGTAFYGSYLLCNIQRLRVHLSSVIHGIQNNIKTKHINNILI